jgi:hypothetical protein
MSDRKLPEPEDEHDHKILGDIARVGWSVIGIEESEEGPGYAFSVGMFHTLKHPEIVIMGLKPTTAQSLINAIGDAAREGKPVAPAERSEDFASFPLAFVEMLPRYYREYIGYARWLYRGSEFPVLQCLWPDKAELFPWQPDYDARFFQLQRVLGTTERWPHGWPFPDVPNVATFTSTQVCRERKPILLVTHDNDGAWQFHTGEPANVADAMVVALEQMLLMDPTLADLGNLLCGRRATRSASGAAWNVSNAEG